MVRARLEELEKELDAERSKMELMNQALCRANLEREELNNKLKAREEQESKTRLQLEELGELKETNLKLLTDLQEAQQKIFAMT